MKNVILALLCFCTFDLLAAQPEARLQRIVVDGMEIPSFDADIHTYTVQLPYTSSSHPHIVAECMDKNASYSVDDNIITCVAADGKTRMQYVVQTEVLPELDIYLCIGQSNMAGRGAFTDATADMSGIYLLNGANQFIPSPARMSQYSNVASDSNDQYWIGPHYQFALDVHAATGNPIGMVVNARGGSDIDFWIPSATGYSKTLTRLKAALAYGKLKGIIWHQGCNQAYGSYCIDAKSYYAKINLLVNGLRKEVGDNDIWFIAGQLAEIGKDAEMHIKFNQTVMNDNIKSAVHNCDYVVSNEVTINPADPIHWDYAGACLMGGRYAKKILSHVYGKEFKITYDLKGGHWPGQAPDSVIRQTSPAPMPVKDGADFWGWFWEKDFSGKEIKTLYPDASDTLYARWSDMERIKVTGVTITQDTIRIYLGTESTLQANIIPINATVKDLTWTSSDETIADIAQTGVFTAKKLGTATISVKTLDGNFTDSCLIVVEEKPRVIYELNGGARVSSTGKCIVLKDFIENDSYQPATPFKMGCTFDGWYWEEDFSGVPVTTLNKGASGTLYAKWNCTEEPKCNQYGWTTPNDMYQDLAADIIEAKKAGFAFAFASTFGTRNKTFGKATNVHDVSGISYDIQTFDITFFSKAPYKAKWGWLLSYMKARCKSEGVSAPTDNAGIRYNLAAFFCDGKGYSWDMNTPTADYTTFGVSSTEYYPMLGAILCDDFSALPEENISFDNTVTKYIQNGQLFIRHEDITYNILGIECR